MSSSSPPELLYRINLQEDGSVVTQDGEYLGTWEGDENDHPSFTPDGHTEPLLFHPFRYRLCEMIEEWKDGEDHSSFRPAS